MEKKYKVISILQQNSYTSYFKSFENDHISFVSDIDEAMNFYSLNNQEITYYLDLICNSFWKKNIKSNINPSNIVKFEIVTSTVIVDVEKTAYENEDFERMKGISKLSNREIELLGLEDYGLLHRLQNDNTNNYYLTFDGLATLGNFTFYTDDHAKDIKEKLIIRAKKEI